MRVFVAGSSGFVGLGLCEALLARRDAVTGFDLAPPPPDAIEAFDALPGSFRSVEGDVRDAAAVLDALRASGADHVVTLAALTAGPAREAETPRAIFEVNVGGALAVAEAAVACGVVRVVHVSSGAVYGASGRDAAPMEEDRTPLRPEGLYGVSKQAAEAAVLRFAELRGLDVVVGRLGTCFGRWERATGARDTPSAPFQILAHMAAGREAVLPRSHPRDWLYARDAADAVLTLLDARALPRRIYNLGAGFVWPLPAFCAALGARRPGFSWRLAAEAEPGNVALYADYDRGPMATDRLRADTGFTPRFGLEAGLEDYLDWTDGLGASPSAQAAL